MSGTRPSRPALDALVDAWTTLGRVDPLWAISTEPAKRGRRWGLEEFLATGQADVASALRRTEALGLPQHHRAALDYGCGVGRLTIPLAERFDAVTGVDISAPMIDRATRLAAGRPNVTYRVIDPAAPLALGDRAFDLVLSIHVLQHLPTAALALERLAALARLVAPGGILVVQLAGPLPVRNRIQPRRRAYDALHRVGLADEVLYDRLGLHPMRLIGVDQAAVRAALEGAGLRLLGVDEGVLIHSRIPSFTYHATPRGPVAPPARA